MENIWKENRKKILLAAGAGIGIYVGFQYLFPLLSPFLLAFCVVYLLNPWLNRVQKRTRIKKEVLLALVLVLAAAAVLGLLAVLLQYAAKEAGELVENWDGISKKVGGQIQIFFGDCCMFVEEHFGLDAGKVEQAVLERVEIFIEELRVELVPGLMKESWWYAKKLLSAAAFLGVSFIASILLCRDYDGLMRCLCGKGENSRKRIVEKVLDTAERILRFVAAYVKAEALILPVIM